MKNVLLVFGGASYEHDISIITASQIYNKTILKDYKLISLYISKDEKYYVYESDEFLLSDFSNVSILKQKKKFKEVVLVSSEKNVVFLKSKFGLKEQVKADLAIIACHGGNGENGRLVSILESAGIYSSAGSFDSLAVCMNKFLFKQMMRGLEIPTIFGEKFTRFEYEKDSEFIKNKLMEIGLPLIFKPNNGGSSIGVFIVNEERELDIVINSCLEFDNEILVEKYISNTREFNVAIIGDNDNFQISDIDEPVKQNEILSFADKYLSENNSKSLKVDVSLNNSMASSFRNFPADISDELTQKIRDFASKIFKKLNLRGVVRIDFLFDEENDKLYVCEVNAVPGSLSFYFFSNGEVLINDFVLKLIKLAEKYKDEHFLVNKEYITKVL